MGKTLVFSFASFQRFKKYRLETGFSMLEAVVVVGVLLALAVGGFVSYGPIIDNAKKTKVKSTASEVYTAVMTASLDVDSLTTPETVIEDFNASNDSLKAEILDSVPAVGAMNTTAVPSENGDFCVQATDLKNVSITARAGTCTNVAENPSSESDNTSSTVTFTRFTSGSAALDRGIRYVNAVLAYDASVANRTDDWDFKLASSEWIERDDAYAELSYPEMTLYDSDPTFRIDSGLPELNADYQAKLEAFENSSTVANQQAMVTAHRAIFAAALANPVADTQLHPSPSYPAMFQDRTIAAGTSERTVVRVALPTSLYQSVYVVGGGPLDGLRLARGGTSDGADGEYTYYDVELAGSADRTNSEGTITAWGVWEPGTYTAWIGAMDNRGVTHTMSLKITVE